VLRPGYADIAVKSTASFFLDEERRSFCFGHLENKIEVLANQFIVLRLNDENTRGKVQNSVHLSPLSRCTTNAVELLPPFSSARPPADGCAAIPLAGQAIAPAIVSTIFPHGSVFREGLRTRRTAAVVLSAITRIDFEETRSPSRVRRREPVGSRRFAEA
jgi:hypothetical protein